MGNEERLSAQVSSETFDNLWEEEEDASHRRPPRSHPFLLSLSILLNVFFLVVISWSALWEQNPRTPVCAQLCSATASEPYSPSNKAVKYEHRLAFIYNTSYEGAPGPNFEKQWDKLLSGTLLRVSEDELKEAGESSVALAGGGYAAGLGVGHQLHCVLRLKKFTWLKQTYPNVDYGSPEYAILQEHADHCVETLRQHVMCRTDFTLYGLEYATPEKQKPGVTKKALQRCVNWQSLHEWMESRSARNDEIVGNRIYR